MKIFAIVFCLIPVLVLSALEQRQRRLGKSAFDRRRHLISLHRQRSKVQHFKIKLHYHRRLSKLFRDETDSHPLSLVTPEKKSLRKVRKAENKGIESPRRHRADKNLRVLKPQHKRGKENGKAAHKMFTFYSSVEADVHPGAIIMPPCPSEYELAYLNLSSDAFQPCNDNLTSTLHPCPSEDELAYFSLPMSAYEPCDHNFSSPFDPTWFEPSNWTLFP